MKRGLAHTTKVKRRGGGRLEGLNPDVETQKRLHQRLRRIEKRVLSGGNCIPNVPIPWNTLYVAME